MTGISHEQKSTALTNNTAKFPFLNRRNIHILQLYHLKNSNTYIPVIFQVASLLAALTHPGHIVIYAPGDSLPCRRDPS
ncbi:hypothetical protein LG003_18535 [Photorhabdus kleinii]|uniref:hypothetical protein n=1 Tax=Photorhabdus kleinii TaxID=768034 RepID=UPI000DCE1018|nr:hypothetical protein [Photorhabdus kleinii]MCT8344782.1 hypothetical protein [Photorhabdus kleinii]RAW94720.1 hypothetical protein CKY03_19145 [Photorhabdus sp. S9-53]RAW94875.1 hypothetical protein CKY05_18935 [Photorhabdus sp. S10-54]RAW98869.1 hypothetical protein CKY04_18840 [Photorhabdus sp. S8-52]